MSKRTRTSKERRRTIRSLNKKIEVLSYQDEVTQLRKQLEYTVSALSKADQKLIEVNETTKAHVAVLTKLRDTTPHAVVKETINEVL